jgi:hypothetical protein
MISWPLAKKGLVKKRNATAKSHPSKLLSFKGFTQGRNSDPQTLRPSLQSNSDDSGEYCRKPGGVEKAAGNAKGHREIPLAEVFFPGAPLRATSSDPMFASGVPLLTAWPGAEPTLSGG